MSFILFLFGMQRLRRHRRPASIAVASTSMVESFRSPSNSPSFAAINIFISPSMAKLSTSLADSILPSWLPF
eukprot:Gb_29946 [translate_table: standard]